MRLRRLLPLLLVTAAAPAVLAGCGEDDSVAAPLDAAVEQGESGSGRVDLRTIDGEAYDRFYVFPPYTSPEAVRNTIGFASGAAEDIAPRVRDGVYELVFVRGDEVVAATTYSRGKVDFGCIEPRRGFPAADAVFALRARKGYDSPVATFARAPVPPNRVDADCPV